MKTRLFFLSILLLLSGIGYAQTERLTNKSIIDMVKAGFSEELIVTKIKTSEANFDTSIDALKDLKSKGVSEKIIMAVMNGKETQNSVQSNALEIKTGIFFKDNGKYTKILPTVFSGSKANTLGAALTGGIASASVKSIMNNAHSNNVISSNRPEFMFYFARNNNDAFRISQTNWWFTSASSPNEFALVRLDIKKNKREMVIGTVNLYSGTKTGVDDVHNVSFKIEAVDDYTFKVTPKHAIPNGEYCFFFQGTIPQGGYTNQSVFDFSIQGNE